MTTLREAAQQALEAIDWLRHHLTAHHGCLHMDPTASGIPAWLNKSETALRAALAEPVQESAQWAHLPSCALTDGGYQCTCGANQRNTK